MISDEAATEIVSLLEKDAPNSVKVPPQMLDDHDYVFNPSEYLNAAAGDRQVVTLNMVVKNIKRGTQIKASELHMFESDRPTDFRYLVLANIQDGIMGGDFMYLSEISKNLEKYCVNDNDLIISRSGAPVRTAVASVKDGQKFLANGNLFIVELDRKRVNPYFIKAYFESAEGTNALSKIMTGSTLPNISVDSLMRMQIPLPSIEEQDAIADKCREKINIIMALKERLAEEMKELKNIYQFLPQYWEKLKGLQAQIPMPMKPYNRKGVPYGNVFDLEKVFEQEIQAENSGSSPKGKRRRHEQSR